MDKSLRNTLRNVVTQCRRLLEESVTELLEGQFGIYITGKVEPVDRMKHLSADDLEYREQLLIHLQHIQAAGSKMNDAVEQLVREVAFTHLNRFCAYKMMETRGLIRKAVSDGLKSQGFLFYLADNSAEERLYTEGKQDVAYRHFLEWLGSTLSEEIGVLFSPHDPANRLLPPQRIIDSVLNFINSEELKDIWVEDETIGWVYQYFTPKELRDKARKESQAPRNSYELAFRNQFYTPSYVVQFLTDNTLGRIWYEMRQGETALIENCKYLVRRPHEVFLALGKEVPVQEEQADDLSQEELLKQPVYILHRPKKDPREIKIIDPACGSGHFLLYCFSLLLIIYEEAYDDPDLSAVLQQYYPDREEYRKAVPGLILAHNLHGIDIDIRATQIAALALWLRAQRAYQEMGIKKNRPKITKSNIVCAEPMPGEKELLDEFVAELQPTVLGQLVQVVFEKMKLVGEAGSLLRIEEEIRDVIAEAKQQWKVGFKPRQLNLLPEYEKLKPEQLNLFDVTDITDGEFWNQAEILVIESLRKYANRAVGSQKLLRQLFADDAMQGFGFVDICRKRFDVVLMNPPFGEPPKSIRNILDINFPKTKNDLFATFCERGLQLLCTDGLIGEISSRVGFFIKTFEQWRTHILNSIRVDTIIDLGFGVLDGATVEAACYILSKSKINIFGKTLVIRLLVNENKEKELLNALNNEEDYRRYYILMQQFQKLPLSPFIYWVSPKTFNQLASHPSLEPNLAVVRQGLGTGDNNQFIRTVWEISPTLIGGNLAKNSEIVRQQFSNNKRWSFHVRSGESQPWYSPLTLVIDWENQGFRLKEHWRSKGETPSRYIPSEDLYFRPGLSWTRRAFRFIPYLIPAGCIPSASRYMAFPAPGKEHEILTLCASNVVTAFMRFYGEMFERPNHLVDTVKRIPLVKIQPDILKLAQGLIVNEVEKRRGFYRNHEPFLDFTLPAKIKQWVDSNASDWHPDSLLGKTLDLKIAQAFGLGETQLQELEFDLKEAIQVRRKKGEENYEEVDDLDDDNEVKYDISPKGYTTGLLSYTLGCVWSRWDVRIALDPQLAPKLPEPFAPLPVCPPATLVSTNGLPASSGNIVSEEWLRSRPDANTLPPEGSVQQSIIADSEYPITVKWDGILVDDPDHPDDIIRRVRDVLQVIWGDKSEAIEQEACEILGVKDLRDYFRKPSNGGFWTDHIKRYSKSRRKAPIYWLLQSSSKNYSIWIYYHRLDKDILFKALINYVEPKLRLEESNLQQLRSQQEAVGTSGKAAKQLEKQIDRQESLISELYDFQDKLRRAANLNLEPDLNDGVVLNIAPLWEIVPWSEAKKYWQELIAGKYEWSSIGKQLRAKGIISV